MAATSMSHIRKHRPLDGLQESFASIEDLENALDRFKYQINRSNFAPTMESIFDDTLKVELMLLSMDESFLHTLSPQLFPVDPSQFYSSLGGKLLQRLSTFFLFSPLLSLSRELQSVMGQYYRALEMGSGLINELRLMAQSPSETPPSSKRKKHCANGRHDAQHTFVDAKACGVFEIEVPDTPDAANEAMTCIGKKLKSMLMHCVENLRLPHVTSVIKLSFIRESTSQSYQNTTQTVARQEDVPFPGSHADEGPASPVVPSVAQLSTTYFHDLKGFGEWKILISTRAYKDLRDIRRKDRKIFEIVVKKIKELSNGHFSNDNQKPLNGNDHTVPIYEAKMTKDTRLVYQVDCILEPDGKYEKQALRIYGIYTHAQLNRPRLWDSFGRHLLHKQGKDYRYRCVVRKRPKGAIDSHVFIPESFPPQEDLPAAMNSHLELPQDDLEEIQALLVLEKYLAFSQEILKSIIVSQALPTAVSLRKYASGILADVDAAFPFQVSAAEQSIIRHPSSCYVVGRSGTGKTTTMLFKMLWIEYTFRSNQGDLKKPRQLFITKSRVLAMKVEEYFMKLLDTLALSSKSLQSLQYEVQQRNSTEDYELELIVVEDELLRRKHLPSRFSELQDSHFPLFLTYDHLCALLLGDIVESGSSHQQTQKFITFNIFLQDYWRHFPQPLTKRLDPVLVFNELMGVILGSEQSLVSPEGYLDRSSYQTLSYRTQSTFADQRPRIYDIFEVYLHQKKSRGVMDIADRTLKIHRWLSQQDLSSQKLDFIYVDEAQDNLLIDACVIRSSCRNPNGLFWAGDTAQTISAGSSFRFDDLKSFMFRVDEARSLQVSSLGSARSIGNPKTFFLQTNYRSHSGIVDCAHSIIEIITEFWPYAIDKLGREVGVVGGQKPIFLSVTDDDQVEYEQFLFGSSQNRVEFGAQQCILVRDDNARDRLRERVGDIGIILTLYESKGLEFDDVLLFNFFEDSNVNAAKWRVILNAAKDAVPGLQLPQFSELRHAGICLELKNLYVAVTRARKNLWIADSSNKSEPMKTLWSHKGCIQVHTSDMQRPTLATTSTKDEYAKMARELFQRRKFFGAKQCYEKASMQKEATVSEAYYLREQARKASSRKQKQAFADAAEMFVKAAEVLSLNQGEYYKTAGECFEVARMYPEAIHAFMQAKDFNSAARLYRTLGRFDDAIALIQENEHLMDSQLVQGIKFTAKLEYFRKDRIDDALALFSSDGDVVDFLEDHDLDLAHTSVLCSQGKYYSAAKLHLEEGRTIEAIQTLSQDSRNKESRVLMAQVVLQELWSQQAKGIYPTQDPKIRGILSIIDSLGNSDLDPNTIHQIDMFKALYRRQIFKARDLAGIFRMSSNLPAAYLCLDLYFSEFPEVRAFDCRELSRVLEFFLYYSRLLYELAFQSDDRTIASLCKIFGFRAVSEGVYVVPGDSRFQHLRPQSKPYTGDITLTTAQLLKKCHLALRSYLQEKVKEGSEKCQTCRAFDPCLHLAYFGRCSKGDCHRDHNDGHLTLVEWYTARVRLHIQQILIVQTLHADARSCRKYRRQWIRRLYNALYPSSPSLGSPACLATDSIPEYREAIRVIADWARERAYSVCFASEQKLLSVFFRTVVIALLYDRKDAMTYLPPPSRTPVQLSINSRLLKFLQGSVEQTHSRGLVGAVWALQYVISSKIHIDVSVLCDLVDFLCASSIFNNAYRYRGCLHQKIVPRSWLLLHLCQSPGFTDQGAECYYNIVNATEILLRRMYTGVDAEHLLFGGGNLSTRPFESHGFINRICRSIGLLGINIRNEKLRTLIENALKSLRSLLTRPPPLYGSYVFAEGWRAIAFATFRSLKNYPIDEMVQLFRRPHLPRYNLPFVRNIVYGEEDQLLHQLQSNVDLDTRHDHLELDDSARTTETDLPDELTEIIDVNDAAVDGEDSQEPDNLDEAPVVEGSARDVLQSFTTEEIGLITAMQRRYTLKLRRRQDLASVGRAQATRNHLFVECLKRAQQLPWAPGSLYKLLFLGPLSHILRCLAIVMEIALQKKNKAKKEFKTAPPDLLDHVGGEMKQFSKLYRRLTELRNILKPDSEFHTRFDVVELKKQVQRVDEEFKNLPFAMPEEIQEDLELGLKGIVQPRRQVRGKPSLVWDDDETAYADKFM